MKRITLGILLFVIAGFVNVEAHAFLQHADPAVGSTIQKSPGQIRIWFTEKIDPAFSRIEVFDSSGKEVDKRDFHVDRANHVLVAVSIPPLKAGTYKVVWRAVSIDTHVTKGSFTFRVAR